MADFLINLSFIFIAGALAVFLTIWLYILNQGDAKFDFLVSQRSLFKLAGLTKDSATFTVSIPFVNSGPQDGTIIDLFPRHLLPCEQFDKVKVESYLSHETVETADRSDGYWEAVIIPKKTGGAVKITVKFVAKEGDISSALEEMVDMPINIICQAVSRSAWRLEKTGLIMPRKEIAQEMANTAGALKESEVRNA